MRYRVARRAYRVALFLYPADFRRQLATEMEEAFVASLDVYGRRRSSRKWMFAAARGLWDVVAWAAAERWHTAARRRKRGRAPGPLRRPDEPDGSRRGGRFDGLMLDVKFGARSLRRNPGFATVVILTLAVGIGATTAALSVVDAVLLRPLPYEDPQALVSVHLLTGQSRRDVYVPGALFRQLRERDQVFSGVAAINFLPRHWTVTGGDEPVRVLAGRASAGFFDVLGVDMLVGREFGPSDEAADAPAAVILSHSFWHRSFGGAPDVVGRVIRLDGAPYIVVGVTPARFVFPLPMTESASPDLWISRPLAPLERRDNHVLAVVGRLRTGMVATEAEADTQAIVDSLTESGEVIAEPQTGQPFVAHVVSFHDDIVGGVRSQLLMLVGAVGLVLVITWVNVTNLLLVRSADRGHEMALRKAIGAGRLQLARQIFTETLLLSLIGGAIGLALAHGIVTWLVAWAPAVGGGDTGVVRNAIPLLSRAGISGLSLSVTLITCLVTTLVCGVAPASRALVRDLSPSLQGGERRAARGRRPAGTQLLVAVEVALALILLIGVGLLWTTFRHIDAIPLGFDPENVELLRTNLTLERYASLEEGDPDDLMGSVWSLNPRHRSLVDGVVERLQGVPGVKAAGASNILPIQNVGFGPSLHFSGLDREARRSIDGVPVHGIAYSAIVTPDYFRAMGTPIVRGRPFLPSDNAAAPGVSIVNQELVDFFALGDNPVGTTLLVRDGTEWRSTEIVGVVGSVFHFGYGATPLKSNRTGFSFVYLPSAQAPTMSSLLATNHQLTMNFVVRHRADGAAVARAMREAVQSVDPETPIAFVSSAEAYLGDNLMDRYFYALLLGSLATVSLVLALIGVYGVTAFQVGGRTHEIGVRMALGARGRAVVAMIVGEGLRIAMLGALLGVLGALAATRLLENWLYRVSATDPFVFAAVVAVLLTVALLACWIPARLAARVDPIASLRNE